MDVNKKLSTEPSCGASTLALTHLEDCGLTLAGDAPDWFTQEDHPHEIWLLAKKPQPSPEAHKMTRPTRGDGNIWAIRWQGEMFIGAFYTKEDALSLRAHRRYGYAPTVHAPHLYKVDYLRDLVQLNGDMEMNCRGLLILDGRFQEVARVYFR